MQENQARLSKEKQRQSEKWASSTKREQRDRNAKSNALRDIKRQALEENELQALKYVEAATKKITRNQRYIYLIPLFANSVISFQVISLTTLPI